MQLTRISSDVNTLEKGLYLFSAKAPEQLSNKNQRRNTTYKIISYGSGNNYPQELIRAVMSSPIASGCAETHAKYIAGDGFIYPEGQTGEQLKKIFTNDFLQKIAYDFAWFGGFAYQLIFDMNGDITGVGHVDFSTVRLGELDEWNQITYAMISADWEQVRAKENKAVKIDLYDPITVKETIAGFGTNMNLFRQWNGALVYCKRYRPGETYYPRPKYASALNWIYADGQIQEFHANNVDNAFLPSTLLYVPFELTGEMEDGRSKTDAFKEDLKKKTGAKHGGEPFIIHGPNKEGAPEIIPFTANTNHELFIALSDLIRDHISSAFQIPPLIAGIMVTGKLGSSNEIENSIEMYYNGVIKHDVNFILEKLNKTVALMNIPADQQLEISNSVPFSFIDPALFQFFDEEEIRESKGYAPRISKSVQRQQNGTLLPV